MAQMLLFVRGPLKILEADHHTGGESIVDLVHVIVDTLIHRLDAADHSDLALQLAGLMVAGQLLQLVDQLIGLFGSDKTGSLDRIHQQF